MTSSDACTGRRCTSMGRAPVGQGPPLGDEPARWAPPRSGGVSSAEGVVPVSAGAGAAADGRMVTVVRARWGRIRFGATGPSVPCPRPFATGGTAMRCSALRCPDRRRGYPHPGAQPQPVSLPIRSSGSVRPSPVASWPTRLPVPVCVVRSVSTSSRVSAPGSGVWSATCARTERAHPLRRYGRQARHARFLALRDLAGAGLLGALCLQPQGDVAADVGPGEEGAGLACGRRGTAPPGGASNRRMPPPGLP